MRLIASGNVNRDLGASHSAQGKAPFHPRPLTAADGLFAHISDGTSIILVVAHSSMTCGRENDIAATHNFSLRATSQRQ